MTTAELGRARVEELSHHGVLGMKWGRHRERVRDVNFTQRHVTEEGRRRESRSPSPIRVNDTIGRSGYSKTSISTTGGEDHPAHPDALKVAASKQKLQKSGTHALSNQELRDLATRIQLEEQAKTLTTRKGRRYAQKQLEIGGQQQIQKGLAKGFTKGVTRVGLGALV